MKEDLMFCCLGNGISVCDCKREEHGDYKTVAHIGYNRDITYYDRKISQEAVDCIQRFARYNNLPVSQTQNYPVLKPVDFSQIDVSELKGIFQAALEAHPQFAGVTLKVATFPMCGKTIIHSSKEVCLFFRDYYSYMVTDLSPREDSWILIIYDKADYNSQGNITDY